MLFGTGEKRPQRLRIVDHGTCTPRPGTASTDRGQAVPHQRGGRIGQRIDPPPITAATREHGTGDHVDLVAIRRVPHGAQDYTASPAGGIGDDYRLGARSA